MGTITVHTYGESRYAELDDGRRLHYWLGGAGRPIVVFESGMGTSGAVWGLVQPAVAHRATTVVYDRAGLGRSDDGPAPRDLAHAVADLAQLLDRLPGHGPYLLVGHSWGGPIVRTLAASGRVPVRGLVLVDQSDENAPELLTPQARKRFASTPRLLVPAARTGLYRLTSGRAGRRQPADVRADHYRHDFTVRAARTFGAELHGFVDDLARLRDDPCPLEGIEVAVISGTRTGWSGRAQRHAINRAHRVTAQRLDRAHLVEATRSGHHVMLSEPEIVVAEIARMLPT